MVRYPVSVVDHKETIKDPLQDDVNDLKEFRDEQEIVIPDNVISGIKEIENFLANTSDAQTLQQLLSMLSSALRTYLTGVLDTMQMDEQSGDITLQYDNGETEQAQE